MLGCLVNGDAVNPIFNPRLEKAILGIAQSYGPYQFWTDNLLPGMNPDATWRALMVVACLKDPLFVKPVRSLLDSTDSRVRAWACLALGQLNDAPSIEKLLRMNADPSWRVRVHSWLAVQAIRGVEDRERYLHATQDMGSPLILVSDDTPSVRKILSDYLVSLGFRIETATTEAQTIRLARKLRPDAILTDNQKGRDNLSGLNMTWDICRNRFLRETILFMLTADEVEPAFLWNGGDYFLSKGFDLRKLIEVVQEYMVR